MYLTRMLVIIVILLLISFLAIIIYTVFAPRSVIAIDRNGNDIEMFPDKFSWQYGETPLHLMCTHLSTRCFQPAGSRICCSNHLLEIGVALDRILKHQIFLIYDTVLGAIRDKSIIQDDENFNMAIIASDEHLLEAVLPQLSELGYVTNITNVKESFWKKIRYPPSRRYTVTYSRRNSVHVIISILSQTTLDGLPILVDSKRPQRFIYESDVLPLRRVIFMNYEFNVPGKTIEYLNHTYNEWENRKPRNMPYIRLPTFRTISSIPPPRKDSVLEISAYIINMNRDVERLHHCIGQFDEELIHAKKIVNCCTSNDINHRWLSFADVNEQGEYLKNEYLKQRSKLTLAQKNCCVSHALCWEQAEKELNPVLIVEDDISLPYNFKKILTDLLTELKKGQEGGFIPSAAVIRLSNNNRSKMEGLVVFPDGKYLQHFPFSSGAYVYLITPAAAKILVNMTKEEPLTIPLDHVFSIPHQSSGKYNRSIHQDKYLPDYLDNREYMFMEAVYPNIQYRYKLYTDKKRPYQIVQELSTSMSKSRTSPGLDVHLF